MFQTRFQPENVPNITLLILDPYNDVFILVFHGDNQMMVYFRSKSTMWKLLIAVKQDGKSGEFSANQLQTMLHHS